MTNASRLPRQDEERGLKDILGGVDIAQHPLAQTQHHRAMPTDERGERGLILMLNEATQQHGITAEVRYGRVHQPVDMLEQRGRDSHDDRPRGQERRRLFSSWYFLPDHRPAHFFSLPRFTVSDCAAGSFDSAEKKLRQGKRVVLSRKETRLQAGRDAPAVTRPRAIIRPMTPSHRQGACDAAEILGRPFPRQYIR
jgi:hypothetical protein